MKTGGFKEGRRRFFNKLFLGIPSVFFLIPARILMAKEGNVLSRLLGKNGSLKYRGRVFLGRDPFYSAKSPSSVRMQACRRLIGKSLEKLTGTKGSDAWLTVVRRTDVVGLKLNCLAAPNLSPTNELVWAIVESLKSAGVKENNIILWERSNRELKRAGFTINTSSKGVRCFGSDALSQPYKSGLESSGSVGSLFSNIIASLCTAIINVGVLKDHDLSGVGAGMKNFYGVIHNPNKYHENNCNPYIADLCNHRYIREKLKLTFIDARLVQYDGGPAYNPSACVDYNSIIVSFDMVAADRVAYQIIDLQRKKRGRKTLKEDGRNPVFLETAAKLGLGETNLAKIKIFKA